MRKKIKKTRIQYNSWVTASHRDILIIYKI